MPLRRQGRRLQVRQVQDSSLRTGSENGGKRNDGSAEADLD